MDLSNPSSSRCQRKRPDPPRNICEARSPAGFRLQSSRHPPPPRPSRRAGRQFPRRVREKRQKIGRKQTNLSVDSIVLHRAKVFRPEDDDDDGDGGGCPAGRNRRQTAGRRGNAGLFHRRRRRHERFCHEKVGSPIKSKRGTTRAGDRSFRPLCRRRRASLAERGGGEGPIPEATTSSRNLWREAGIGLLPRDADGLKNLLLARCK